jgi:hypothetical protein
VHHLTQRHHSGKLSEEPFQQSGAAAAETAQVDDPGTSAICHGTRGLSRRRTPNAMTLARTVIVRSRNA